MLDYEESNAGMSAARKSISARFQGVLTSAVRKGDDASSLTGVGSSQRGGSPPTRFGGGRSSSLTSRDIPVLRQGPPGGDAGSVSSTEIAQMLERNSRCSPGGGSAGGGPFFDEEESARNTPFLTTTVDSGVYDRSGASSAVHNGDRRRSSAQHHPVMVTAASSQLTSVQDGRGPSVQSNSTATNTRSKQSTSIASTPNLNPQRSPVLSQQDERKGRHPPTSGSVEAPSSGGEEEDEEEVFDPQHYRKIYTDQGRGEATTTTPTVATRDNDPRERSSSLVQAATSLRQPTFAYIDGAGGEGDPIHRRRASTMPNITLEGPSGSHHPSPDGSLSPVGGVRFDGSTPPHPGSPGTSSTFQGRRSTESFNNSTTSAANHAANVNRPGSPPPRPRRISIVDRQQQLLGGPVDDTTAGKPPIVGSTLVLTAAASPPPARAMLGGGWDMMGSVSLVEPPAHTHALPPNRGATRQQPSAQRPAPRSPLLQPNNNLVAAQGEGGTVARKVSSLLHATQEEEAGAVSVNDDAMRPSTSTLSDGGRHRRRTDRNRHRRHGSRGERSPSSSPKRAVPSGKSSPSRRRTFVVAGDGDPLQEASKRGASSQRDDRADQNQPPTTTGTNRPQHGGTGGGDRQQRGDKGRHSSGRPGRGRGDDRTPSSSSSDTYGSSRSYHSSESPSSTVSTSRSYSESMSDRRRHRSSRRRGRSANSGHTSSNYHRHRDGDKLADPRRRTQSSRRDDSIHHSTYLTSAEASLLSRSRATSPGRESNHSNHQRGGSHRKPASTTSPGSHRSGGPRGNERGSSAGRHAHPGDSSVMDRRNWITAPGRLPSRPHVVGARTKSGAGSSSGNESDDGLADLRVKPFGAFYEAETHTVRAADKGVRYEERGFRPSADEDLLQRLKGGGGYLAELNKASNYGIGRLPHTHKNSRKQWGNDGSTSPSSDDERSTSSTSGSSGTPPPRRHSGKFVPDPKKSAADRRERLLKDAEEALAPTNQSRAPYWVGHGRIPTLEMNHTVDDKLAVATSQGYLSFRAGVLHKNGDKMVYFSAAATEVQAQRRHGRGEGGIDALERRLKDTDAVLRPRGVVVCDQHVYILSLPSNVLFAPASTGGCFSLSEFVKASQVKGKPFLALQFLGAIVLLRFSTEGEVARLGAILRSATGISVDAIGVTEDSLSVAQRAMVWRKGGGTTAGDTLAPVNAFVTATMAAPRGNSQTSPRRGGDGSGSDDDDDDARAPAGALRRNTATVGSSALSHKAEGGANQHTANANNMSGFLQDVFLNLDEERAAGGGEEMGADDHSSNDPSFATTQNNRGGGSGMESGMRRLFPSRGTQTNAWTIMERNAASVGTHTGVSTLERGISPIRFDMYGQMIPCTSITNASATPAYYSSNNASIGFARQESAYPSMGARQESANNVSFAGAGGIPHLMQSSSSSPKDFNQSMHKNPSFHSLGNAAMQLAAANKQRNGSPRRGPAMPPRQGPTTRQLQNGSFNNNMSFASQTGGRLLPPTRGGAHGHDTQDSSNADLFYDGSGANNPNASFGSGGGGGELGGFEGSPMEQQRQYWMSQHQQALQSLREREGQLTAMQREEEERIRLKMRLLEEERKSSAMRGLRSEERHADWESHFSEGGSPNPDEGERGGHHLHNSGDFSEGSYSPSRYPSHLQPQPLGLSQYGSPEGGGVSQGREGSEFSHADLWRVLRRGDHTPTKGGGNNPSTLTASQKSNAKSNKTPARGAVSSGSRPPSSDRKRRADQRGNKWVSSDDGDSASPSSGDDYGDSGSSASSSDRSSLSGGGSNSRSSGDSNTGGVRKGGKKGNNGGESNLKRVSQQQQQQQQKGSSSTLPAKRATTPTTPSNHRAKTPNRQVPSTDLSNRKGGNDVEGDSQPPLQRKGSQGSGLLTAARSPTDLGSTLPTPKGPKEDGGDQQGASNGGGGTNPAFEQFLGLLAAPYKSAMDRHGITSPQTLKEAVLSRADAIFRESSKKPAQAVKGIMKKSAPASVQDCYAPAIQQLLGDLGVTRTGHRLLFNSKISMLIGGGG